MNHCVAKNGCIRLQRRPLHGCTSHAANIVYKVCICAPSGNACDTCNGAVPFFSLSFRVPVAYTKLYAAIECHGVAYNMLRKTDFTKIANRLREMRLNSFSTCKIYLSIKAAKNTYAKMNTSGNLY